MRRLTLAFACALALSCHRSVEVKGLYFAAGDAAVLAPCGDSSVVWSAPDSVLRARYRQLATTRNDPVLVRVRGFSADSAASIYGRLGGATPRFVVEQVLEVRLRTAQDCSGPVTFSRLDLSR